MQEIPIASQLDLPAGTVSLWDATTDGPDFPRLSDDVEVDVAVLGAGIVGVMTAYLLKASGARVALVEADRVGRGVSGYTTAKLSALQDIRYSGLTRHFGREGARAYGEANLAGIELIEQLAVECGIDCDFRRRAAVTYACSVGAVSKIDREARAMEDAGLPAVVVGHTSLPFDVAGAIRLDNQAEFHPRRFLLGLAETIPGDGSHVFEHTRALDVHEGRPCIVQAGDAKLAAGEVVVATSIPFLDRGLYFARTHPERSYSLAVRVKPGSPLPDEMLISCDSPTRSLRTHPVDGEEWLLVGGEGHKVGQGGQHGERYERLQAFAQEHFDVEKVAYRWSAQDNMSIDGMPFVGKLTPVFGRVYTATGFSKWGLAAGAASAQMLADRLCRRDNPWAAYFDAQRVKPLASATDFLKENANVGKHFVLDHAKRLRPRSVEDLKPGEGGICGATDPVAAYRHPDGRVQAVSSLCTHLGCVVAFNDAEKSWDCPCHGSRFGLDGRVLQGPAVQPLEERDPPE